MLSLGNDKPFKENVREGVKQVNETPNSVTKLSPKVMFQQGLILNTKWYEKNVNEVSLQQCSNAHLMRDEIVEAKVKRFAIDKRRREKRVKPEQKIMKDDAVWVRYKGTSITTRKRKQKYPAIERYNNHKVKLKFTTPAGGPRGEKHDSCSTYHLTYVCKIVSPELIQDVKRGECQTTDDSEDEGDSVEEAVSECDSNQVQIGTKMITRKGRTRTRKRRRITE